MNNSRMSHVVLRRVRTIYALRMIGAPLLAASVLAIALIGIGREVWVAKVFQNMPALADVSGTLAFFTDAFLHTDIAVQSLSIIALGALVWLTRDLAISIRRSLTTLGPA